jgi:hypothetical protein
MLFAGIQQPHWKSNPKLGEYISRVAKTLHSIGPSPHPEVAVYIRDLTIAIGHNNRGTDLDIFCHPQSTQARIPWLHTRELTVDEALAAAVRRWLAKGGDPLQQKGRISTPIKAAISTGKVECLKILLEHVKQSLQTGVSNPYTFQERPEIFSNFHAVLNLAVIRGHSPSALILFDFIDQQNPDHEYMLPAKLLMKAAIGGCVDLVRALLECGTEGKKSELEKHLQEAIREAIWNGNISVVRYMGYLHGQPGWPPRLSYGTTSHRHGS